MHRISYRVYYEDTDAGQVMYYANYLKFAERARTEWLRDLGIEQKQLAEKESVLFVVKEVNMQLKKPACLDDMVVITTEVESVNKASIVLTQTMHREDVLLANLTVHIVSVNLAFKPVALPGILQNQLNK